MKARLNRKRIEELRIRKALLKTELAAAAGIHMNTLRFILRGEPAGVVVLRKLAKFFGVDASDLIESMVDDQANAAEPAETAPASQARKAS
ncbi:MAG: helix-turn-helix transcriptional regulator [Planctomycetota bacterium]